MYTARGDGCGFYSEFILLESKAYPVLDTGALKQLHSKLRNCFSNAAIDQNRPLENRNRVRAKYIYIPHQINKETV